MELFTQVILLLELNQGMGNILGQTTRPIKASGKIMNSRVMENICGKMVANTLESFQKTNSMERANLSTKMGEATLVNSKMIKSMGKVFTNGHRVRKLQGHGLKASSLVKLNLQTQRVRPEQEYGRMDSANAGWILKNLKRTEGSCN